MKKSKNPTMSPHAQKLQAALDAELAADPVKKREWEKQNEIWVKIARESSDYKRKMRPAILKINALWDSWFTPESPTSKRRGGNKMAPSQEFIFAVAAILDAKMGMSDDFHIYGFEDAMKSADPKFFLMLAEAAQYVRDMPQAQSTFAKHVIAARRIAADMMGNDGPLPSKAEVKAAVSKQLAQEAYGTASPEWSRVWAAAGLKDLPR